MSKICLIRPAEGVRADSSSMFVPTLPLGLAYIAASAREAGHDVQVIDAVGEGVEQLFDFYPGTFLGLENEEVIRRIRPGVEIIGVGNMFSHNWPCHRDLLHKLRASFPEALLVMGGEHATSLPEMTLRDGKPDLCVMGEGEETFVELAAAHRDGADWRGIKGIAYLNPAGELTQTPRRPRMKNIDDIPLPAWDLVNVENYKVAELMSGMCDGDDIPFMPILATRGCPYQCTFCTSPNMWTTAWIARDPEKVLDEIELYIKKYGARNFRFQDLTAITRKDWIISFCKAVVERKLDFIWQLPGGTRSEAIDGEVAGWLKKSGMLAMAYAPESGSDRIRTLVKKRVKAEAMYESASAAVKAGLKVQAFLIVGFPDEKISDAWQTVKMAAKLAWRGIDDVVVHNYMPYPGSELFQRLLNEGKVDLTDESLMATLNFHKVNLTKDKRLNQHYGARTQLFFFLTCYATFHAISLVRRPMFYLKMFAGMFTRPVHDVSILQKALKAMLKRQNSWVNKLHDRRVKSAKESPARPPARA